MSFGRNAMVFTFLFDTQQYYQTISIFKNETGNAKIIIETHTTYDYNEYQIETCHKFLN